MRPALSPRGYSPIGVRGRPPPASRPLATGGGQWFGQSRGKVETLAMVSHTPTCGPTRSAGHPHARRPHHCGARRVLCARMMKVIAVEMAHGHGRGQEPTRHEPWPRFQRGPDHAEVGEYMEKRCGLGLTWPNHREVVGQARSCGMGRAKGLEHVRVAPLTARRGDWQAASVWPSGDVNRMPGGSSLGRSGRKWAPGKGPRPLE